MTNALESHSRFISPVDLFVRWKSLILLSRQPCMLLGIKLGIGGMFSGWVRESEAAILVHCARKFHYHKTIRWELNTL